MGHEDALGNRAASLKGSRTEANLRSAFSTGSQTNRLYLYFAQKAEIEGLNDIASMFRSTAEGETGHAHGHLEFLEECGDPLTGRQIGETVLNLASAIAAEASAAETYAAMAVTARDEGHADVADWFELLAKTEKRMRRECERRWTSFLPKTHREVGFVPCVPFMFWLITPHGKAQTPICLSGLWQRYPSLAGAVR